MASGDVDGAGEQVSTASPIWTQQEGGVGAHSPRGVNVEAGRSGVQPDPRCPGR